MRYRGMAGTMLGIFFLAPCALALSPAYEVDSSHRAVSFTIRDSAASVQGVFQAFEAGLMEDFDEPGSWVAFALIRDERFPGANFVSTRVVDLSLAGAKVYGLLRMGGREEPVVVDLKVRRITWDQGKAHADFKAVLNLSHRDFGISWSEILSTEAGVGENIEITIEGQGYPLD